MFTETFSFSSFFPFQIRKKKKRGGGLQHRGCVFVTALSI